jgi:TetR/AcrR family transcriptional regulator
VEKLSNEKRLEILIAAMNLFAQKGFERTTVDEIADRASIGKGTVYLYFKTKEAIFRALIEKGLNDMEQILTDIAAIPDFGRQIHAIIHNHLEYIETNQAFYRMFLKERLTIKLLSDDQAYRLVIKKHHSLYGMFANLMQQGINQGYLRPGDPNDYGIAISGIINHFAGHWIMLEAAEPLTAKTDIITEIILSGIQQNSSGGAPVNGA